MTDDQGVPVSSKVVAILGPTAAGKTALSFALHERFNLDIISMDSAQVYRRLNIGTAKPDSQTLSEIPHHLIDIREPWQAYTAADFVNDAMHLIQPVRPTHPGSLVVGGTMMYFHALLHGLSPLPEADAQIRLSLERDAAKSGWSGLHQRLMRVDPVAANRINPNDQQRIQRALEVFEISGQTMTQLQQRKAKPNLDVLKIVLQPTLRKTLHERIEIRYRQMLENGLIEEVESLLAEPHVQPDLPSMKSVGYRQVCQFLSGQYDRSELENRGIFATRQLAKRQLTWLRKEPDVHLYDPADSGTVSKAEILVEKFLSQG